MPAEASHLLEAAILQPATRGDVGLKNRCLIIGEVGQAHDGSLGAAHCFIDAIAQAGADAVKFQTHIAAAESTPDEPWRVEFSSQDATRYDYWKRTEFNEPQWRELRQHAVERGLLFLSSPFSLEAVDLLIRVGLAAWKVASGEVTNIPMLERMAATGLPLLLSTGMSSLEETDRAVKRIRSFGVPLAVLQCTSVYPTPPESIGLNLVQLFRDRYQCAVGLSDHSGTIYPALAAAAMGANVLEVHVTLSRQMFGPDVPASLTLDQVRQLVEGVRFIERVLAHPVDKDALAAAMEPLKGKFTRSVVARTDLFPGTTLNRQHLTLKKPGSGIPAARMPSLLGRRLRRAVKADQLILEGDLEGQH
jgi:N-acetylneuraminate synthase